MRLGRVIGTVTGTVKDRALTGRKLLLIDLVDAEGNVIEVDQVAVDTVGAGEGDLVLVAAGSAARQATDALGLPADLAVVVIVEEVTARRAAKSPPQLEKTSGQRKKGT
jgi:microcompartment protein CcmK/EutM